MFKIFESSANFHEEFNFFLNHKRTQEFDVSDAVKNIIKTTREDGDSALVQFTEKFDGFCPESILFSQDEIETAKSEVNAEERAALKHAAKRIRAYHERQMPERDVEYVDDVNARLGWRFRPITTVGIYVPGGQASYPSSVLMNAVPAKVAGVSKLVMCVPCPQGEVNPLVLLAADLAGVDQIFKVGGAQAIAAMAYGTETVPHVDKIMGPGNAYVAEAKRQVFGHVGIDMIAGPSEVVIIADAQNNPDWIAMDLLSQAEHDQDAQSVLITDNEEFAKAVENSITKFLKTLERREIARESWKNNGAVIIAKTLQSAAHISNQIAPEHLQICAQEARALSHLTHHAGAIFIGSFTPEAIGDYIGGPNHVLPTSRSARFSSGLNLLDYMKRTTVSELTPAALSAIGPSAVTLAKAESLEAHGLSVSMRLKHLNEVNS